MKRDRHHIGVVVKHLLDAIAVVGVKIQVEDADAVVPLQPGDRQGHIVVDTETGSVIAMRMVKPAANVQGMVQLPSMIIRAATRAPPAMVAEASCIRGKTGLSPVPSPSRARSPCRSPDR